MTPQPARRPRPPVHLSTESAKWWRTVVSDFDLEPHHHRLLQSACEAWDRMQQARKEVADFGRLTVPTEGGGLKPHPAVAIERDARLSFARLLRELDLDSDGPVAPARPPALGSNRR